jgi:hypothetical protein
VGLIAFRVAGSQGAAASTATAQANATRTLVAGVDATRTAIAGPVNCGQVSISGQSSQGAAALDSASCFQFAFESCRPAQISLLEVDSGRTRTFSTGKEGTRCYIMLTTQLSTTSQGQAPALTQCLGEALQMDGLHISGCDGQSDILIPAPQQ